MKQIEHDKDEPEIDRRPESFTSLFCIVIALWAWYLYFVPFDWRSVLLGFITGSVFMLWSSVKNKDIW